MQTIQASPDLHNSYIPEVPAQVNFSAGQNWVYIWSTIYVYTRYSSIHMVNCICLYKVFQYTCGQLYVFIQGIPVEIQTATYWGLVSCSIMALLPLLLPISILPPHSSHSVLIPTRKNMACIMKVLFLFHFFKNHVIWNYISWNCIRKQSWPYWMYCPFICLKNAQIFGQVCGLRPDPRTS
jgi:hypothetical protein